MNAQFFSAAAAGEVNELIKLLPNVNDVEELNEDGYAALHLATKGNHLEAMKLLLSRSSPDIESVRTMAIKTSLHMAAKRGLVDAMKILVEAGANVNKQGYTSRGASIVPLFAATIEGQLEAMKYLLENGANMEAPDVVTSETALSESCILLMPRSVRLLLEHGAKANDINPSTGETPLMCAAKVGSTEICQLLVTLGRADVHLRSSDGLSAFDFAVDAEMWAAAHYLWTQGAESRIVRGHKDGIKGTTWIRPYFLNPVSPRHLHTLLTLGSRVYCFGGSSNVPEGTKIYNPSLYQAYQPVSKLSDFFSLDLETCELLDLRDLPLQNAPLYPAHALMRDDSRDADMVQRFNEEDYATDSSEEEEDDDEEDVNEDNEAEVPSEEKKNDSSLEAKPEPNGEEEEEDEDEKDDEKEKGKFEPLSDPAINSIDEKIIGTGLVISGEDRLIVSRHIEAEDPTADDCGTFRAAHPFFSNQQQQRLHYFEVTVLELGASDVIAVGLVSEDTDATTFPGWELSSYGMHSDDGRAHSESGSGQWGRKFGAGDTVGCGILCDTQEVFFTLNGTFLGVAFRGFSQHLHFPCIGVMGRSVKTTLNFGATHFAFNYTVPVLKWTTEPSPALLTKYLTCNLMAYDDKAALIVAGISGIHLHIYNPEKSEWTRFENVSRIPDSYIQRESDSVHFERIGSAIYGVFTGKPVLLLKCENIDLEKKTCDWSLIDLPSPISPESDPKHSPISTVVFRDGKFWLVAAKDVLIFDPISLSHTVLPTSGARPNVERFALKQMSGDQYVAYGGFGPLLHSNALFFFDTKLCRWYQSHRSGVTPRPRSLHPGAVVTLPCNHLLLTHLANLRSSYRKTPVTACLFYGGSSTSDLNDGELLVFNSSNRDQYDETSLPWIAPSGTPEHLIITFKVSTHDNAVVEEISAFKIILASRCSTIRARLAVEEVKEIEVKNAHPAHWKRLLQFLADDQLDFEYVEEETRAFYGLAAQWCPEHAERISEALLMNVLHKSSRFHLDLAYAFDNASYSDVDLVLKEGRVIKAHRCILMANLFFKHMFTSGLSEATAKEIKMTDCSSNEATALVRFIYTRTIELDAHTEEELTNLLALSDQYLVEGLKARLESLVVPEL